MFYQYGKPVNLPGVTSYICIFCLQRRMLPFKGYGVVSGGFLPLLSASPTLLCTLPRTMLAAQHSSPPPNSTAEPKSACSLCTAQGSPPGSKKKGLARRKHRLSILLLLIPRLASYGVWWPASLPLKWG